MKKMNNGDSEDGEDSESLDESEMIYLKDLKCSKYVVNSYFFRMRKNDWDRYRQEWVANPMIMLPIFYNDEIYNYPNKKIGGRKIYRRDVQEEFDKDSIEQFLNTGEYSGKIRK